MFADLKTLMRDTWISTPGLVSDTVSEFLSLWQCKISLDICTTDISKAFLQGVTYKELAEATGEPLREVHFYVAQLLYRRTQNHTRL
jgi:hypothetical protein